MGDCRVVIERVANGYEVEVTDPAAKSDGLMGSMKARKEYVFKTIAEVLSFLNKNLDKALPVDEYDSAFDAAVEDDEDD
jgi:hypothetical protein